MKKIILILLFFPFCLHAQENVLQNIINENAEAFKVWVDAPEKHQVQILYTQIDRDENNRPSFTTYSYGLDTGLYYYPASTVKMPAAFLALEKLNELQIKGLNKHTVVSHSAGRSPQSSKTVDASAKNRLPCIAHYIKKIFLVSDNDAYNRLYEFLGQQYINDKLQEKGFAQSRIIHRLSVGGFDVEGNRHTNPVSFIDEGQLLYHQGEVYSSAQQQLTLQKEIRGKAFMKNDGTIVNEPFDFRHKNFISILDLQDMLKAVIFPDAVPESQRFNLTDEDYQFLYQYMSMLPRESDYPKYEEQDNYVKFWIHGDRDSSYVIPSHLRAFNKVGWAYGFLTDVSYIIDLENKVEFFLTASIHVNENETYNDGVYEYEAIALPFFGELGRKVYDYELQRKRKYLPDLSQFKLTE